VTELRYMIVGLLGSGKTTFLAAFWHLMNAGEIATKLELDRLEGDTGYLNTIVEAWRRCQEVPRTSIASEQETLAIHIRQPNTEQRAVLVFPDLSGESFKRQVASRKCRQSYINACDASNGILLFVTADRAQDDLSVRDVASMITGDDKSSSNDGHIIEWNPDLVPEQVHLVELLQFLQRPPFKRQPRRVAVLVSAWDVLPTPQPTPEEWVQRELPLLHQFLRTNTASFAFRIYGISAQGGDVRSGAKKELLQKVPSERLLCIGAHTDVHDLTAPILWLMEKG
jgi:Double-GTPase 1